MITSKIDEEASRHVFVDGNRQPQNILNTRRRVTRCSTRAQSDKGAQEHLTTPVQVDLGRKIDTSESVITIEDRARKVNLTLQKVEESSYIIEGIPTLRSRTRQREEMSRYNDRFYSPRERDYRDNYYAPPPFERRQVAKKSTAQQSQAHQYHGHKRPSGPDFNQGAYKRPRVSHGDDYRYNRGPPEFRNGVDGWREREAESSSGYYHRGRGRPPKFDRARDDFGHDDWGNSWAEDSTRGGMRCKSSEPNRKLVINEETNRSQSQGPPPSRGRGRPPKVAPLLLQTIQTNRKQIAM
ncbi:uncharacterized protein [Amphiura filiformis]|uniref:uncharacterized protein isoform X2 n=1 Tax=Amphiura filiformis TaxID=82378 RepID=UPI003B21407F